MGWTTTLPAASGWYYCRPPADPGGWFVAHVNRATDDMGGPLVSGGGGSVGAERYAGCEWWPEAIPAPPTGEGRG